MVFTIALAQCAMTQYEPEANLAKAETLIERAAAAGAQIAVLPEDFVTGPISRRQSLADSRGRYRAAFRRLARKHAIDLVPGSIIEREGGRFANATYYIDSRGAVLARYCKTNLWLSEKPWVTPGRGAAVADSRWGKVGLAICWDLAFPELFRESLAVGAEIVICPSLWCREDAGSGVRHNPESEVAFVDSLCVARAFENEIVLAFCNAAGTFESARGTVQSMGHSQVAVPFRGAIAKVGHGREKLLLCEVDTAILGEAETAYEIREDCGRRRGASRR